MRTPTDRPAAPLPGWCADLLDRPDALHRVAGRVWSTTSGLSARSAPRDRGAEGYDALAASRGYLRTAWGLDPVDQRSFARSALASRRGPLVDVACGGLALTADLYARSRRPLLLVDRSLAVLLRAEERLARRGEVVLVQSDLDVLPLRERAADTVACLGVVHLVPDAEALVTRLAGWVRPGGTLYLSSLTRGRPGSDLLLDAMHRAGELAPPRTPAEVVRSVPLTDPRVVQRGAMTYVDAVVA